MTHRSPAWVLMVWGNAIGWCLVASGVVLAMAADHDNVGFAVSMAGGSVLPASLTATIDYLTRGRLR